MRQTVLQDVARKKGWTKETCDKCPGKGDVMRCIAIKACPGCEGKDNG